MRLRWLAAASRTRLEHLRYIARHDLTAARRADEAIKRHVRSLSRYPDMGRVGRVATTRELVVGRAPLILVYRIKPDDIEILRVLHGAQRWPPEP